MLSLKPPSDPGKELKLLGTTLRRLHRRHRRTPMITRLTTAAVALLAAAPTALAHPGHDHAATVGGEWHHLLWLALPAAAGVAAWVFREPIKAAIKNRRR